MGNKNSGRKKLLELNPEIKNTIIQAIEAGNYGETAAGYAGIGKSTYWEWLAKGEEYNKAPDGEKNENNKIFAEFAEAVEKARAKAQARAVAMIAKAMPDNWQAAAWYLERTAPHNFGRMDRLKAEMEHRGKIDHQHSVDLSKLTDEELIQFERILAKAAKDDESNTTKE